MNLFGMVLLFLSAIAYTMSIPGKFYGTKQLVWNGLSSKWNSMLMSWSEATEHTDSFLIAQRLRNDLYFWSSPKKRNYRWIRRLGQYLLECSFYLVPPSMLEIIFNCSTFFLKNSLQNSFQMGNKPQNNPMKNSS